MSSCSKVWTIEFRENKSSKADTVNAWKYEPDIYSVRNIAGKLSENKKNTFSIGLELTCNLDKRVKYINDNVIDTIVITYLPSGEKYTMTRSHETVVTYPSEKYIKKVLSFYDYERNIGRLFIPEEIDSILLSFNSLIMRGELTTRISLTVEFDSIAVLDSVPEEIHPVEIKMKRHVSTYHVPFFLVSDY